MATNLNGEGRVGDSLLNSFDNVMAAGDLLPLDELKKRYRSSSFFEGSFRKSQLFHEVFRLPIGTEAAVFGAVAEPVKQILDGVRRVRPDDELIVEFDGDGDQIDMTVRMWRPEEQLRALWTAFAESEYRSENLGGAA